MASQETTHRDMTDTAETRTEAEWRQELTPEQYREKWNLPSDYPMVAPNYAEARSNLAKQMGLGRSRREVA